MREHLLAQLSKFRKDDEARWKYEAERIQHELRVLEQSGRSDQQVRAKMSKLGIDVKILEEEAVEAAQRAEHAFEHLSEPEAPPARYGRKEPMMLQRVAALAGSHTWLFDPAVAGWGNAEQCGFNLEQREINIAGRVRGSGWGWDAVGYVSQYCTL